VTSRWRSRSSLWLVIALLAVTSTLLVGGLSYGVHRTSTLALATCQPSSSAGQTVQVSLTDGGGMMGQSPMMLGLTPSPTSVAAGRVTFVATNYGGLNHEFLVLPMPADGLGTRPVGADGKIDESSSLGEASKSCAAGAGNGIAPGARSWVTLDLCPGTYELLCDLPWHYANGMYSSFTVT